MHLTVQALAALLRSEPAGLTLGIATATHSYAEAEAVLNGHALSRRLSRDMLEWRIGEITVTAIRPRRILRFHRRGRVQRMQWPAQTA